jgi:hypothetical protein
MEKESLVKVYDCRSLKDFCNSIGIDVACWEEEDEPGEWWRVTMDGNRISIGYTDAIAEFFAVVDTLKILEEEKLIKIVKINITEPEPGSSFKKYNPDFCNFINVAEVRRRKRRSNITEIKRFATGRL